jgi:hypothetical protein
VTNINSARFSRPLAVPGRSYRPCNDGHLSTIDSGGSLYGSERLAICDVVAGCPGYGYGVCPHPGTARQNAIFGITRYTTIQHTLYWEFGSWPGILAERGAILSSAVLIFLVRHRRPALQLTLLGFGSLIVAAASLKAHHMRRSVIAVVWTLSALAVSHTFRLTPFPMLRIGQSALIKSWPMAICKGRHSRECGCARSRRHSDA